jgi:hypothetical protein
MTKPNDEYNPYAAPLADPTLDGFGFLPDPKTPDGVGTWRDGDLLVMCEGARLPDRCVKCNQQSGGYLLKRKLYWHHPAWYLLILLHFFIFLIVYLIVRKKVTVMIPVCERHRRRRIRAIIIGWSLVLVGFVGVPLTCGIISSYLSGGTSDVVLSLGIIVGIVLILAGAIYGNLVARVVAAKRIEGHYAWMSGVERGYLASLPSIYEPPPVTLRPVGGK